MTTVIIKQDYNPATKQYQTTTKLRITRSRKHGRPRNAPRVTKIRKLHPETGRMSTSDGVGR